jgi:3-dehydroquinate dehydratase
MTATTMMAGLGTRGYPLAVEALEMLIAEERR